ncbi:hypothetical protein DXG01_015837 [Tephrocybe rancida]|nr:hypothetical protein DXG01_015837 [Tephrocybe rancida]
MQDPRQFLDLEAEVDDESKDESDDKQDGFIDDDIVPVALDRTTSHHQLFLEHTRIEGEEWQSLLDSTHHRAATLVDILGHISLSQSLEVNGIPDLWRVAVKPRHEESRAFVLMKKILGQPTKDWKIKSIVGRVLEGEAQVAAGVITALVENEAIVKIENGTLDMVVSVDVLRKHISIGDEVNVVLGPQQGMRGWVTSIKEDLLSVYDHRNAQLVDVLSHCITFVHAPMLMGSRVASTGPTLPGIYKIGYVEGKEDFNRPLPPGFHNIYINGELK